MRKIAYLERFRDYAQKILNTRDRVAKVLLNTLKVKYPGVHIPVYSANCSTTFHWPAIIVEDRGTLKELRKHKDIQFGNYTWPYLLTHESEKYPNSLRASLYNINVPNWDPKIGDCI
jgi:hypothetical protein